MSEKKKSIIKEFGLSSWAVTNRTTVLVITALILFAGISSYNSMPKEAFPEVTMPMIYVQTPYPGNSPENMEKLITRPLEKEINTITGIDKLTSNSVQDFSAILVEFSADVDVAEALIDVKDAIDRAKSDLPTDLDNDPMAIEMNMSETPIMNLNLYGNYSPSELKEYGEDLKDIVEDLPEISKVNIKGIEEKEVAVNIDFHKLTALKLSFNDVANAIKGRNVTMSVGTTRGNGKEVSIKVDGEFKDVSEIENIIIKHERAEVVYLKNILSEPVKLTTKEKDSYARFNGQNVIMLDVIKESGENLLSASDKIEQILKDVKKDRVIPSDVNIDITLDMSDQTRAQVDNLENSIISGVILVVGVLLFFLGTRNSLFVGIAIPMSMFLSFIILSTMGVTINMMVLFGLIMALGMLVDNGIVVVENVYRLMDEGYSPMQAAKEGVGEVAWPIISSTATTLAAFIPLAFWPGIMGEFMQYLPITLIIVLGSSLFVALVINSALTSVFMKVGDKDVINKKKMFIWVGGLSVLGLLLVIAGLQGETYDYATKMFVGNGMIGFGNFLISLAILLVVNLFVFVPVAEWFQTKALTALERGYEKILAWSLKGWRPIMVILGMGVMLFLSIVMVILAQPKVLFFPDNEPRYVNAFVEMPLGTPIEETNELAYHLEEQFAAIIDTMTVDGVEVKNIVNSLIVQVGKGTSDPGDPFANGGSNSTPHKARVTVEFVDYKYREGVNTQVVMDAIRANLNWDKYPDAVVTIEKDRNGPPAGKPINIELTGEEYAVLIEQAEEIKKLIASSDVEGVEELKSDLETGKPEMVLNIDKSKSERMGVGISNIAQTIRTALFGSEVSKFKDGEDDYPIQLRLDPESRNDMSSLMNLDVTFRSQSSGKIVQIPINSVATLEPSYSFGSIRRKNMDRVITLYSNVIDGYNPTEVNNNLKTLLEDYHMPDGYTKKFTGEQEEQEKNMAFLGTALIVAVASILLIIVAQFNRVSATAIIGLAVLFSIIGVFIGLVSFNMSFIIIMTMIGIISLAGVVVNNAIVLLDYTILLMDRKKDEIGSKARLSKEHVVKALTEAGKTRLRPVLLTAITTVLGLVPLAVGINIDFFGLFKSFNPNFSMGGENVIFWGPMCWTIIFGITFATFLTLVVVPVMFLGIERLKARILKD